MFQNQDKSADNSANKVAKKNEQQVQRKKQNHDFKSNPLQKKASKQGSEAALQKKEGISNNKSIGPEKGLYTSKKQKMTAELRHQQEDIKQNKPSGMSPVTYLKLKDSNTSEGMIAQAKFASFKKSQVRQYKGDKYAKTQFNSKVKQFERNLVQRKIDYGSDAYYKLANEYFPGYATESGTTNAQPAQNKKASDANTAQLKENKTGLPNNLKSGVENLSGLDISDVRVHRNSDKPASLNAHAYTEGTDIHVAPGQEKHIAHEAWHVVQQMQGRVKPTTQIGDTAINDNAGLENEADVMGNRALQMKPEEKKVLDKPVQKKQIAQRNIDVEAQDLLTIGGNIRTYVNEYNELGGETTLTARMTALAKVERAVYAWFSANKSHDLTKNPTAALVQNLMNRVKAERTRIINKSVTTDKDQLNEDGALPIAGFELLDPEIQGEVRTIWSNLISGEGNLTITEEEDLGEEETETHAGFKMKVLTEFSRMLESEFGRGMIKKINASEKTVVIEPYHQANTAKSFAANALGEHGSGNLTKLGAEPEEKGLYPDLDLTGMEKAARLQAINNLQKGDVTHLGVHIIDENGDGYYKFGAGSNVKVTMPSDTDDSTRFKESRLVDTDDYELATPLFITLGHELGHAIHMQRGVATGKDESIKNFVDSGDSLEHYGGDTEEYINITGNENKLRADFGLGTRKGHHNIPYVLKTAMEEVVNAQFSWLDKQGLERKYKNPVEQVIINASTRIFTEWADPDKLGPLQEMVEALPERLKGLARQAKLRQEADKQKVKVEESQGSGKWCYITTACTQAKGLPDDCEELTVLRQFRDTYLAKQGNGKKLIEQYYKGAPAIVEAINHSDNPQKTYSELYSVIRSCVDAIKAGNNKYAFETYCDLVYRLKDKYAGTLAGVS